MRVTLLLLVLLKSVISNEESDEKYIDLLPEEEKRQFLEKIARRILEDYQNNNETNASHVDMSDEELNAHSAYVQGLLQEETQNLRDEKKNEPQRRDDKQDTAKAVDNRKSSAESNKNFVDLTLRAGKREKRRNTSKEHTIQDYDVIPVVPIYDETLIRNKPPSQNTTRNVMKRVDSSTPKNNSKVLRNSFTYDDEEDNKNENNHESNESLRSTVINDFEPSSKEIDDDSSQQKPIKETTTDLNLNDTVTSAESPRYGIRERDLTRKENVDIQYSNKAELTTDIVTQNLQDITSTTPVISTSSTTELSTDNQEIVTETNNTFSTEKNNIANNALGLNNNSSTIKNDSTTSGLKLIDLDINSFNTSRVTLNSDFTKVDSTETPASVEISTVVERDTRTTTIQSNTSTTVSPDNISNTTSDQEVNLQNASTNCNDTEKAAEHLDKESKRTIINDMDLFEARKGSNKGNILKSEETIIEGIETIEAIDTPAKEKNTEYYVYEISAEKPPFRSRGEEEVYYAPVYNYAPEYAYYDPYNRFGPNTDDVSKDSFNTAKARYKNSKRRNKSKIYQTYNENRDKFNNIFNILKQHNYNNIVDPQSIVHNSAIFNPNDYIDMDYFFGRSDDISLRSAKKKKGKPNLPDTDDDDHPYETMKNSLQDHIRSVRKLLYAHKQFGYIPDRPKLSNEDETRLRSKHLKLSNVNSNGQSRDDITIDYYFGRKNSHEVDSERNKLFKVQLAQLKDASVGTPKPAENKTSSLEEINQKDNDIDVLLNVLRDMIKMDIEGLVKYDWLRSTVDIRTALSKLNDLTKKLRSNDHIHPNDMELLKYVIYLYKSAKETDRMKLSVELLKSITKLRKENKKKSVMPQIKKRKKYRSAIKLWRDFRTFLRSLINREQERRDIVGQFERFLAELVANLNGLHEAIKNIATVTKFKNQNWYADLKEIYLKNATKRELLEVILHLGLSRLLALIEDSTKSGAEDSFSNFVFNNRKEVNVTRRDFIFVLRLLNAIKELN